MKRARNPVKLRGVTVAHALHDRERCPLQYWYWIKAPCGGWLKFDIRELSRSTEREALIDPHSEHRLRDVADFCDALPDPVTAVRKAMAELDDRLRHEAEQRQRSTKPYTDSGTTPF